jgi:hypothetical protein
MTSDAKRGTSLLLTAGGRADGCSGRDTGDRIKISLFNTVEEDGFAGATQIVRALFWLDCPSIKCHILISNV